MEYKLSAQLQGHQSDVSTVGSYSFYWAPSRGKLSPGADAHRHLQVRDVVFPKSNTVISVSRDNTVRTWQNSSKPPAFDGTIVTNGSEFINSVAYIPPSAEFPDGLIVSGGKDTIIEVKKPLSTPADNAERLLIGHAHNICSLDVSPKGTYVVSGSWDKQAIVWKVGKWEPELRLEGHEGSVWGVLALDETIVVTGSADEKINIYDLTTGTNGRVRPRSTIHTSNVVRAVVKVPQGHPSGADIASAHNDGVIRLWALNGSSLGELHGHDSFVYSLKALPTGELVSSGEDRSIRIWKGFECVQTITVPAISVWSVAVCQETGDIVAGSSDSVARIFTRNDDSVADAETITLFDDAVKASAIPQQQMDNFNKEKLPGPDFLTSKSGTKEGQVQMIREGNGSVSAHQWSQGKVAAGYYREFNSMLTNYCSTTTMDQRWNCGRCCWKQWKEGGIPRPVLRLCLRRRHRRRQAAPETALQPFSKSIRCRHKIPWGQRASTELPRQCRKLYHTKHSGRYHRDRRGSGCGRIWNWAIHAWPGVVITADGHAKGFAPRGLLDACHCEI